MPPRPAGQCGGCRGWGLLPGRTGHCRPCRTWRTTHPALARCVRCGHEDHTNLDDHLCRPCLTDIRLLEPAWPAHRRRTGNQLMLLLPDIPTPFPQPIVKHGRRIPGAIRPPRRPPGTDPAAAPDDERICPPTLPGQLALFAVPPRTLTARDAGRIRARVVADHSAVCHAADDHARDRGVHDATRNRWKILLRLVLAARTADGEFLVSLDIIDSLDAPRHDIVQILRTTGLLATGPATPPAPARSASPLSSRDFFVRGRRASTPQPVARSCEDCDAWGNAAVCNGCRRWRSAHPAGRCGRCHRPGLPVVRNTCRGCTITLTTGHDTAAHGSTQLWLGGPFAPSLRQRDGHLGYRPTKWRAMTVARARRPVPHREISPHLVDPDQTVLLDPPRDWRGCTRRAEHINFSPAATALLARLAPHAAAHRWDTRQLAATERVVGILLGWLGAAAPVLETDVRAVAAAVSKGSAHRALHFLTAHHTVIADPSRRINADERAVHAIIAAMPPQIGNELRRWVQVQRGLGRRPHSALPWGNIRGYLTTARPLLETWAETVDSLRQITAADINAALNARTGNAAQARRTALRSIFRSLKQERAIFADPTRGSRLTIATTLPTTLPSDSLDGLLDRTQGPLGRLAVALVAVHALGITDMRALRTADIDLTRSHFDLTRAHGRPHRIYLDTVTHRLATAWLQHRQHRWPLADNPHLLLTDHNATATTPRPIAVTSLQRVFTQLDLTASRLRQDRIVTEAALTADPVHLMRLFGISAGTAMRYVAAAHPERHA